MRLDFHLHLHRLEWILRIGFGVIFVVSGVDKFFNLMTYWPMYISEPFASLIPFSPDTFMHVVGVVETLLGLAMVFGPVRLGALAASAWMIGVAINLITAGLYDLASRDVAIALGMFGLAGVADAVATAPAADRPSRAPRVRPNWSWAAWRSSNARRADQPAPG